jgi:hypothetical protein
MRWRSGSATPARLGVIRWGVGDADLPGKHARRIVIGSGFLDAEMHCLGSEADEVRVLRALVDDRQAESFVEGTLSGQVTHVQHWCQPGEQA